MDTQAFLDFVRRRAGATLRVVTWYTPDEHSTVYVRDDIDESALQTRVDALYSRLTTDGDDLNEDPLDALGEEKAMVQVREEAVILHFRARRGSGFLVSLDADAARDLHSFVAECLSYVEGAP